MNKLGIVDDIGSRRHRVDEGSEIAGATYSIQSFLFLQTVGEREYVDRLTLFIESEHGLIDAVVIIFVEVAYFDEISHFDDGVLVEHE